MANIYVSNSSYAAVTAWSTLMTGDSTANGGRGTYVRATAPAAGSERVFRCTTSGTAGVSEPTWTTTHNGTTTDGTITWTECTGQQADQVAGTLKAPHARLENAFLSGWSAAGDDYYVGASHAQTQASALTLTAPGTAASPNRVLCISETPSAIPPVSADLSTGGKISTTGASTITTAGFVSRCKGLTFSAGDAANLARIIINDWKLSSVNLTLGNTSGNSYFSPASLGNHYGLWENVVLKFGGTGQIINFSGSNLDWKGGSVDASGSLPTNLFSNAQGGSGRVRIRGVDLSALSAKTILGAAFTTCTILELENCKLPASITLLGAPSAPSASITTLRSVNGAVNYNQNYGDFYGTHVVETTVVRTGGASDNTVPISWKIDTSTFAKSQWTYPFVSLPIDIWNDVTGSTVTVTVYGTWSAGAVPNNDDIWIEIDYLGSGSSPLANIVNTTKADYLASGAAVASDGVSTWGGSISTPVPFKLVALLDTTHNPQPAQKGIITVRICVAKQSLFYIDPKVVLS